MKTADAIGPTLNWLAAKCEGYTNLRLNPHRFAYEGEWIMDPPRVEYGAVDLCDYEFSTDWAQGGPIIERHWIHLTEDMDSNWVATRWVGKRITETGPTPLVAAMRCYVASKLGDEVDVPEGLT